MAEMILSILNEDLDTTARRLLDKAARGSLSRRIFGYTSMAQEFARVVGAEQQINKVIELFQLDRPNNLDPDYMPDIERFIAEVAPVINKQVGGNNFVTDRLNKSEREVLGIDLSKRAYNKKWRLLKRLENKLLKMQRETKKREFQMIAKHGLAHQLEYEAFAKDKNTACFIAYYNARCNLRSTFTNEKQARPYDEICDMLFKRCTGPAASSTNWLAIAQLYTGQQVLSYLSDEEKGILLGKWTSTLQEIASLLDELWASNSIKRETMIVQRGNDSSTWNNTAGAWNKARDQWMNLIYSLGLESILDVLCFGKVMRLMAADVAYWHQDSGGKLDPNTEVWSKLPLPWEVFSGLKTCNRQLVIHYCREAGIDAERSGWIAPRPHGIAAYSPTPELVHGVTIANPFLASILKKHKFFSAKNVLPLDPKNN